MDSSDASERKKPPPRPAGPSASVAVPPTHVPVAPVPAQVAEPTVVIAQPAQVELPRPAPEPPRPAPEPPSSSPRRAPVAPGVSDEPDWATRTHLPVSRETARTARKTSTIFLASVTASLTAVAVVAALLLTRGGQSTSNASGVPASGSDATNPSPTPAVPGSSNVPLPASANAATTPSTPEAEARAALGRLRDGIGVCVREVIGVLPGTSPAVPARAAQLKGGAYKSHPRDFASPVFSCAKYRETEPQRFQIQWQVTVTSGEGRGVAWLDDDGDGKADRALSFRAALVRKKEVDLGEIGFLTPVPPVMKPRP